MSQAPLHGARQLQALEAVRSDLAGICQSTLSRTVTPNFHEVIEKSRRHRGLQVDVLPRDFSPLDRPFLALDAILTSKVSSVFLDLGHPLHGATSYDIQTEKIMGPARVLHTELKSAMRELLHHLLMVDMQNALGAHGERIRKIVHDLHHVLSTL